MPPNDIQPDTAIGILISQVGDLRDDIKGLRDEVGKLSDNKVSYREWSQRNTEVNGRFTTQGREIGDLRTEVRAKSAPWWSVAAVLAAAASLAWQVLGQ